MANVNTDSTSTAQASFPAATILGFPRIGPNRELKRAVEAYWAKKIDRDELLSRARQLRIDTYQRLVDLGLGADDASIPATFSYYDQVLDATALLGTAPERFKYDTLQHPIDQYFLLARGGTGVAPQEMTKWFNTNYHYLVPEIGPETTFELTSGADGTPADRFLEAKEAGFIVRPTLVGPLTYLLLAKPSNEAPEGYSTLERLDEITDLYVQILQQLADAGAPWVQLDEPGVTSDNLGVTEQDIVAALNRVYQKLGSLPREQRPAILVTTPYGGAKDAVVALTNTPVEAIHADLIHGQQSDVTAGNWRGKTLVSGSINGRNIWRADLGGTLSKLEELRRHLPAETELSVATSTSLQHVPYTTEVETWDDPKLNEDLHLWLAFADQKVVEVAALATGLILGKQAISDQLTIAEAAKKSRHTEEGVSVPAIRQRTANLQADDRRRISSDLRLQAQAERFNLPVLPTTTIGSFPQTPEIRQARASHAKGLISDEEYQQVLQGEIRAVIELQEDIGLDVLVHGEAERNDMVQYFAELLDGFAVTRNGWVQSYGSRCTRPSLLWGDVSRPAPMTVNWATYAQSLTDKPVKGMLTGPVTILAWSFVREDLPLAQVADQVALALRDEVADLESAGIGIIQVDEPALRELLPLRLEDQPLYLDWSVGSFRLATSGVRPDTQIHTHLCYSEFGDVITAIDDLDADVTSLEAARSHMEVLPALAATGFKREVGPGIYDIHSPRVPSAGELSDLLRLALQAIPAKRIWSNPDCGLKTRTYAEVVPSLQNLVEATKLVRAGLPEATSTETKVSAK